MVNALSEKVMIFLPTLFMKPFCSKNHATGLYGKFFLTEIACGGTNNFFPNYFKRWCRDGTLN